MLSCGRVSSRLLLDVCLLLLLASAGYGLSKAGGAIGEGRSLSLNVGLLIIVLLAIWWTVVRKVTIISALTVFLLIFVLEHFVSFAWLVVQGYGDLRFYMIDGPSNAIKVINLLSINIVLVCVGWLLIPTLRERRQIISDSAGVEYYWFLPYLIGLMSILIFTAANGGWEGISQVGDKAVRRAGHGLWVYGSGFLYVSVVFWYLHKLHLNAAKKVIGFIVLVSPALLMGSRGEILTVLIACLFIEGCRNRLPKLKLLLIGLVFVTFGVLYQWVRLEGVDSDFFESLYKDLRMPIVYLLAEEYCFFKEQFHISYLIEAVPRMLPGYVRDILMGPMEPSANKQFTLYMLPNATHFTASMGTMGEGVHIFTKNFFGIHFVLVGLFLGVIDKLIYRHLGFKALLVGSSLQIAKSGLVKFIAVSSKYLLMYFLAMMMMKFCHTLFKVIKSRAR